MKHIMLLAVITLVLFSCKKNKSNPCPTDIYSYTVFAKKQIDTNTLGVQQIKSFQVVDGSNLVFEYSNVHDQCAMAIDGGYARYIDFEIPSDVSGFNYTDDDLLVIKCFTRLSCFCYPTPQQVTKGNVQGQKLSAGRWRVKINITIPGTNDVISVNNIFTQK